MELSPEHSERFAALDNTWIPSVLELGLPWVDSARAKRYRAIATLLMDQSCAATFAFLNDYVNLAITCRKVYGNAVLLPWYAHLYVEWKEFQLEQHIAHYWNVEQIAHVANDENLCQTCHTRQGLECLAYVECSQCYDEH